MLTIKKSQKNNKMNDSNISNISNISINNSQMRSLNDRTGDRTTFSSFKVEKNGMRVPNLNFSKLKNIAAPKILNSSNLGPKTSRDILRNKINTLNNSKSNNKLNDTSLNNSVNDVFKSISNRSHLNNNKLLRGNVSNQNKIYKGTGS